MMRACPQLWELSPSQGNKVSGGIPQDGAANTSQGKWSCLVTREKLAAAASAALGYIRWGKQSCVESNEQRMNTLSC